MSTGYVISLKFVLYAKPDQVFKVLTDPIMIKEWSHASGELNPEVGGHFSWFDNWVTGEIISVDINKSIVFTWKPKEWPKKTKVSLVNLQLTKHPAGTEVVLSHTDLPSNKELKDHKNGWIDFVFDPINDYLSLELLKN